MEDTKKEITEYNRSISGLLQSFITDLPKQVEAMQNIIENFDKNKYQEVINFAKAANRRKRHIIAGQIKLIEFPLFTKIVSKGNFFCD